MRGRGSVGAQGWSQAETTRERSTRAQDEGTDPPSLKLRRTGTSSSSGFFEDRRGRRSRVVLASVADAKSRGGIIAQPGYEMPFNPRGDGGKKELVAGESAKETVKTMRREGRMIATTCGSAACFLLHADHGCGRAPGLPCSLFIREDMLPTSTRA